MTQDQMIEYAKAVAGGAKYKGEEVRAFMRALLADHETAAAQAPSASAPAPDRTLFPEQPCPLSIRHTDTGIHLGPEANRDFNWREVAGLINGLADALSAR